MPPAGGEGGAGQTPLNERLVISSPVAGSTVGHSFAVAGSAPGPWFFEASFPVQVRDGSGNVIGRAVATAGGDWMTEGPVPFTASVTVDAGFSGRATLVLLKDNPSGLPENDDAVEISIVIQ